MQPIKAIVVDDEKMARTLLEGMIHEFILDVTVVETCSNLAEAVKAIRKHEPDLVFLDIEMPGHSGLELLNFFNESEIQFSIIFTTAFNQYAIQALQLSAIDYILKPIEIQRLEQAIDKFKKQTIKPNYQVLQENLQPNAAKKLVIPTVHSLKFVEVDLITHLHADGAYTKIYLHDDTIITTSKSLKMMELALTGFPSFFRCHRSYIVNINYVNEYIKTNGGSLLINHKHTAYISSDKTNEFLQKIQ